MYKFLTIIITILIFVLPLALFSQETNTVTDKVNNEKNIENTSDDNIVDSDKKPENKPESEKNLTEKKEPKNNWYKINFEKLNVFHNIPAYFVIRLRVDNKIQFQSGEYLKKEDILKINENVIFKANEDSNIKIIVFQNVDYLPTSYSKTYKPEYRTYFVIKSKLKDLLKSKPITFKGEHRNKYSMQLEHVGDLKIKCALTEAPKAILLMLEKKKAEEEAKKAKEEAKKAEEEAKKAEEMKYSNDKTDNDNLKK